MPSLVIIFLLVKKLQRGGGIRIQPLPSDKRVKYGALVIANHLAKIINLSIELDIFPSKCKIVKIKPLFRKEIKTKAKHFRTNFLLAFMSKVSEKLIPDQTQDYLIKC